MTAMSKKTSSWKEGDAPPPPELDLDLETICFIMLKARAFEVQEGMDADEEEPEARAESEDASDAADDKFMQVLEMHGDDPTFAELKEAIDDLNVDQQSELVALTWLGRGDYTLDEWSEAVDSAREERTVETSLYLLGTPLLADLLSEGLAQFGLNCEDSERQHL